MEYFALIWFVIGVITNYIDYKTTKPARRQALLKMLRALFYSYMAIPTVLVIVWMVVMWPYVLIAWAFPRLHEKAWSVLDDV